MRVIEGILGSNDTSRAIASIISLVHRELMQDPDFELAKDGKMAILSGLTKALTAFALLQYVTHKRSVKQLKTTVLWKGLVIDEETSEEAVMQYNLENNKERKQEHDAHVLHELQKYLAQENEQISEQQRDEEKTSNSGQLVVPPAPFDLYEITTTTKRTTTTTTCIKPVNSKDNPSAAKYVIVRADEQDQQAFMAMVENGCARRARPRGNSLPTPGNYKVLLSSLSQKLSRKKVERKEKYETDSMDWEPVTVRSSSTSATVSAAAQFDESDDNNSNSTLTRRPSSWNSPRRSFSDFYPNTSFISRKKQRNSSPPSSLALSSPPILPHRRISSANNTPIPSMTPLDGDEYFTPRAQRSNSISSVTSISKTLTTTTFSNTPQTDLSAGCFPRDHLVRNIARFMRYASAAYGESFMRILGIGNIPKILPTSYHHHSNHHAFAHHTGVAVEDILLSSYTDRSMLTMHHPSIHELVHYVTVDHNARAIVLTCRGTLGLSDLLTDLTCTYSTVKLPEQEIDHSPAAPEYKAHGGMLEAAQFLAKAKGKIFRAIREGLEQYPAYGLVLVGHSLGGGVASLLGILWSETRESYSRHCGSDQMHLEDAPFVISPSSGLPHGRPIHCYVYGPPCVMSRDLSEYCGRGLVTSIVHGYDIVSCLSLGLLKDFKNIAVSLHKEAHVADDIIRRVVGRYRKADGDGNDDDEQQENWFWAMIKTLRADMQAEKLYPPSTIYIIESAPKLASDTQQETQAEHSAARQSQHRRASTVVLSRCDNIHARFSEIVFSRSMFMDHSPSSYEKVIRRLCRGYFGEYRAYEKL